MINSKKITTFIIFLFVCSRTIYSQQIVTDRPDQTESSSTVVQGSIQIEMGIITQTVEDNRIKQFSGPSTLIRYGISDKVELRIFNQYESYKLELEGGSENTSGWSDLEVGMKIQLFKREGINTEIAFLSHLILPIANDELSNGNLGTINKLSISHNLSKIFSLGYNVGYDYVNNLNSLTYSAALGFSISKKLGGYLEPFGIYSEGGSYKSFFDIGLTYLILENFQLDISYGLGLNNDMYYFSTGLSWNIPRLNKYKKI